MPSYTQGTSQEVLPDGSEVEFVVEHATEKESSNGNEMIELELRIMNGSQKGPLVYDNLVFTEKSFWKIDHFRECTGEKLIPGQVVVFNSDDCLGRRGRAILTVDVYQGRSKNKIGEYVLPGDATAQSSTATSSTPSAVTIGKPGGVPF